MLRIFVVWSSIAFICFSVVEQIEPFYSLQVGKFLVFLPYEGFFTLIRFMANNKNKKTLE